MKFFRLFVTCVLVWSSAFAQSENLAEKSAQARDMMAAGKFTEAAVIYRELIRQVPDNSGLLLNLGMALQMAGDDRGSIPHLQAAAKFDPKLAPAWLFLGNAYLHLGRTAPAIDALRTVLRLQPDHQSARTLLAGVLLSLDRATEAAAQYRKLTEADSANSAAWYGLGRSYESLAVREFSALNQLGQDSAFWLILTAEAKLRDQQLSSAFYLYRRALEKAPNMHGLHAALAGIYRQTEHPEWAAIEEEKERQLAPLNCSTQKLECAWNDARYEVLLAPTTTMNSSESHFWAARTCNQLALQAFVRLEKLPPSSEQHEVKAQILNRQKRYSEAANEWKAALNFSPDNPEFLEQLAINLKLSQDYAAALPLFQKLLQKHSTSAELNYLVGDTLLDLQRPEDAIPYLERSLQHSPKSLPTHKSLARANLAIGEDAAAIPHLKLALPTDHDGSLHFQLAQAYRATGQPELGTRLLADYQRMQASRAAESQSTQEELQITPP